ncbi:hypothetical protein KUTeg_017663 [Tegillarca granosa]|uniref:Laccase domain-containing protein 1 n=1 Tax=Tegillarca granosa TaxID=220873 RepID=A0ABQ9EL15_TEGGR|nr:hypothetical protein KUTeg_017663 [Tegillarca granosa]
MNVVNVGVTTILHPVTKDNNKASDVSEKTNEIQQENVDTKHLPPTSEFDTDRNVVNVGVSTKLHPVTKDNNKARDVSEETNQIKQENGDTEHPPPTNESDTDRKTDVQRQECAYPKETEADGIQEVPQKEDVSRKSISVPIQIGDKETFDATDFATLFPEVSEIPKEYINIIVTQSILTAFYTAKRSLDLASITDITLYCSDSKVNYWSVVERIFLTPVHTLKLPSSAKSSTVCDKALNDDVLEDAYTLVRGLPSNGQIKLFHSSLIPSDIFNHGFTSRNGGVSYMPGMKSLNLSYSNAKVDPLIIIKENRARLAKSAGFDEELFHLANAVHGNAVHIVGHDVKDGGYDGLLTNEDKVTVAAPGADCITTIFADPVQRVCGAAHAGWKGTISGITTEMVRLMEEKFNCKADNILVVMGPSIGKCCFEFGEEESKLFSKIDPSIVVRRESKNKPFIDLQKANRLFLERHGVRPEHIDDTSATMCTSCNPELDFNF